MALREYKLSAEDAVWLPHFQWDALKAVHGTKAVSHVNDNGLFVFPTHAAEWQHNKTQLLKSNQYAPVAKLTAISHGSHANVPSDKAGGLLQTLYICKGCKVMLTGNINVPYGLYNGSAGVVIDILYFDGQRPSDALPDVVIVEVDKYTGPSFVQYNPKPVPIVPVERKIDSRCHGCKRTQIPLRLGWGTTIHRCQGMTIGKGESNRYIAIDPGSKQFESRNPGALFVAMSRAKSAGSLNDLPDFVWHPEVLVNPDRLCHVVKTPTTSARANEIQRIAKIADLTKEMYKQFATEQALDIIKAKIERNPVTEE